MAIDTAERRRAAGALRGRILRGPGVTPNVDKDVEWRSEAGWSYPGILAGSTVVPGALNESLRAYLNNLYGITQEDVTPLVDRYIDADSITDKNISMRELKVITDVENR